MHTKLSTMNLSAVSAVPSASSSVPWMCRAIGNDAGQQLAGQRVQRSRSASRPARHASSAAGRSDRSAPFQIAETAASWHGPRRASLAHVRGERGTVAHVLALSFRPTNTANAARPTRSGPSRCPLSTSIVELPATSWEDVA